MSDRDSPVTPEELHAYVDGEMPADRRGAVEAWLAAHPDDAARVAAWRAQADAIHLRYGAIATEPVPPRFELDKLARSGRAWRVAAAVAAAIAFVLGASAGWVAHSTSAAGPSALDVFNAEALGAHKLYIAEVRHPIEVKAGEQHLLPWLSRRVGTPLRAPDLGEFSLKLLGGRLLPGPVGPAALLMYESPTGERYTFYCSKSQAPRTAFRYHATEGVAAVQWVESEIGFVMSGPANRDRLLKIAQTAYEQMESRPPARSTQLQLISRRGS
jgi:anti-sigma factor RsiW